MFKRFVRLPGLALIGALVAAALVVCGWPSTASAQGKFPKMDIKLGHVGVLDMSYHKASVKFAELMKERTGGAITVHVFPNSQLGSEKDMQEQVKNGVIHIIAAVCARM